jgi:hypothetical protein
MHLGAAELFVVGHLAGRHLHERRATEEDLRATLDHDDVVRHPGHVRPAGGRVPENQRDGRDPGGRLLGEIAEPGAAGNEDLALRRKIRAAGLDEVDDRQPVLVRDLRRAALLLRTERVDRSATDRGVMGLDEDLRALHHTDPRDDASADGVAGPPGAQRRELEERGVGIDQQLDALTREKLAALAVPLDGALTAAGVREGKLPIMLSEHLEQ